MANKRLCIFCVLCSVGFILLGPASLFARLCIICLLRIVGIVLLAKHPSRSSGPTPQCFTARRPACHLPVTSDCRYYKETAMPPPPVHSRSASSWFSRWRPRSLRTCRQIALSKALGALLRSLSSESMATRPQKVTVRKRSNHSNSSGIGCGPLP